MAFSGANVCLRPTEDVILSQCRALLEERVVLGTQNSSSLVAYPNLREAAELHDNQAALS